MSRTYATRIFADSPLEEHYTGTATRHHHYSLRIGGCVVKKRNSCVPLGAAVARSLKGMTSSFSEDDADYYTRNCRPIEQLLSEAVSEVMCKEPTDPFQYLADYLARRAQEERQRRALEERQRSVICVSDIHGRREELIALWDALMKELGTKELAETPVVFLGECVLAISSRIPRREA